MTTDQRAILEHTIRISNDLTDVCRAIAVAAKQLVSK
jgi:hypothetical protein